MHDSNSYSLPVGRCSEELIVLVSRLLIANDNPVSEQETPLTASLIVGEQLSSGWTIGEGDLSLCAVHRESSFLVRNIQRVIKKIITEYYCWCITFFNDWYYGFSLDSVARTSHY